MSASQPALFVPHGSPNFALCAGAAGRALADAARTLATPRAIIIVSAHWASAVPTVGFAERPATIHDFYGFPVALYALNYPASGAPAAAAEVAKALGDAGMMVAQDPSRGLDHGAWIPLRLMFPDADLPVIPLSLPSRGGPAQAHRLGQALAPLLARNFLLVASGNLTHNLADYQRVALQGGQTPAYVQAFTDWLAEKLAAQDVDSLLDYRRLAPGGVAAHPSEEHLLPLFVALGAAGRSPAIKRLHAGIDDYVIAMDAYAFTPEQGDAQ